MPHGDLSVNTGPFHQQQYDMQSAVLQSPPADQMIQGNARSADQMHPPDTFRTYAPYQPASNSAPLGSTSGLHRSNSDSQFYGDTSAGLRASTHQGRNGSSTFEPQRHASFGSIDAARFQKPIGKGLQGVDDNSMQWQSTARPQQSNAQGTMGHLNGYNGYVPQQNFPSMPTLPPPGYPSVSQNGPFQPPLYLGSGGQLDEMAGLVPSGEHSHADGGLPVFDHEGYTRSPVVMADNFAAWLFNEPQPSHMPGQGHHDGINLDPSLRLPISGTMPNVPPQTTMAVTGLLEPPSRQSILSEAKRRSLIDLIMNRFNETNHSPVAKQKEQLLSGNRDKDGHVLSLRSLQTYIGSYWYHFHDQMPILHWPTFSADKAQPLLLIAIIAIGAANLDRKHGEEVTNVSADLANFLAWHLRGELFMDQDFRPPSKLWVLQSLILLECYEKLYSSRVLHERSQIHHATTISLLRRGSALLGRSAMDSPPDSEEKSSIADTGDLWWNHWITNEATKRIAYAAFIIDSIHATMFSHTAVMLAHEMRLPLPCDEALWDATSGMEVGRIESSLRAEGIKATSFLDGLKWTLNSKPVRTNRFGRTALMAGLLNVSFHLGQRDAQVRSLGQIGGKGDVWRGTLTKAYDIWERDWSNEAPTASLSLPISSNRHIRDSSSTSSYSSSSVDEETLFESRVVLHHLAHMGMHVDIVQCQIYAKAKRLLGRRITDSDYNSTVRRMREYWAPKPSARDAVFYSLKFLGQVLTPDITPGLQKQHPPATSAFSARNPAAGSGEYYNPRDDYLLNRPWVLYFSALVIWSYGYALDGPLPPEKFPKLETKEEQIRDMRAFMQRIGAVESPEGLASMKERNGCAGMLVFLRGSFEKCRWELMHEAGILLGNCVEMLRGNLK